MMLRHLQSEILIYMCEKCTFVLLQLPHIMDFIAKCRSISISDWRIKNRYSKMVNMFISLEINNVIDSFISNCEIKANKFYLQYFTNYQFGFYNEFDCTGSGI